MATGSEQHREWMTLAECAAQVGVAVELVRGWCVDHEHGKPGLPSTHFGRTTADKAERLNRRVHVDDWQAFKLRRRQREVSDERRAEQTAAKILAVKPFDLVGRRRVRATAGGVGRDR